MNLIEIRPLKNADDRSLFTSGHRELDTFLRKYAGQNQFKYHIGTTYVVMWQSKKIKLEEKPQERIQTWQNNLNRYFGLLF